MSRTAPPAARRTTACVFPGNVIPQSGLCSHDESAAEIYSVFPTQVQHPAPPATNQMTKDDKAGQRVDVVGNKKTGNWFIYYIFDDSTVTSPLSRQRYPGFPSGTFTRAQQAVLSNIHVFGPTAVNEARVSFMRTSVVTNGAVNGNGVTLSSLGFVEGTRVWESSPVGDAVPKLNFNNFALDLAAFRASRLTLGRSPRISLRSYGRHSLKFGANWSYLQVNDRNIPGSATF